MATAAPRSLLDCLAEQRVLPDGLAHGDEVELEQVGDPIGHDDAFLAVDGLLDAELKGSQRDSANRHGVSVIPPIDIQFDPQPSPLSAPRSPLQAVQLRSSDFHFRVVTLRSFHSHP